jgi:hypothetical protein
MIGKDGRECHPGMSTDLTREVLFSENPTARETIASDDLN